MIDAAFSLIQVLAGIVVIGVIISLNMKDDDEVK